MRKKSPFFPEKLEKNPREKKDEVPLCVKAGKN